MENQGVQPKLSVIVPVYNVEKTLKRCLDSILNQTYTNFEVILVNDGSVDRSLSICQEYEQLDNRIRLISQANGGLSAARNTGIAKSSAPYLCFIDSDDWVVSDMFEHMIELIVKYNADIVSTSYQLANDFTENPIQSEIPVVVEMTSEEALENYLKLGMANRIADYPVWTKCYRKSLFENINFPIGVLYEDIATNVRLILVANKYIKSSKVCYNYYQGGSSIIRSPFKLKNADLIKQNLLVEELISEQTDKCKDFAKQKTARSYFSLLMKIAVFGFDESIDKDKQSNIVKDYTRQVRRNLGLLLKSSMPINRKLLVLLICLDYRLLLPLRLGIRK